MAAATHMVGSAHSSSSISPPPPPPRHPVVVLIPNQQHQALYDLVTPSPFATTPATATASPPARHNHDEQHHLRPASRRRAGKQRRPRPSRKLPTTYIRADAASFRSMVHQVTGADDDVVVHQATETELLCRSAPEPPSRASLTTTAATLLPTLDMSAFLLGAAARAGGDSGRATPARPAGASCCQGSAVAVGHPDPGATLKAEVAEEACGGGGVRGGGGEYSCSNGSASAGGGFPSLEPWHDDALF